MAEDEDLLLAVLNSAPVAEGVRQENLTATPGERLARDFGGSGSADELAALVRVRDALQSAIRGDAGALEDLTSLTQDVAMTPTLTPSGLHWNLTTPPDLMLAARTLSAWSQVQHEQPGRLRACANTECNLFLVDHSRPGTAKWCSMATCGNRMKVRAHAQRSRASQ